MIKAEDLDLLRTTWYEIVFMSKAAIESPGDFLNKEALDIRSSNWKKVSQKTIWLFRKAINKSNKFIRIDSEWLRIWFGIRILESEGILVKYLSRPLIGQTEMCVFTYYLGLYMLYQIHCIRFPIRGRRPIFSDVPGGREEDIFEAETRILEYYGVYELGLPSELNISKRLLDMARHYLLAYGANETYREHLFHAIDVCLLGLLLLDSQVLTHINGKKRSDSLAEYLSELMPVGNHLRPLDLYVNWFIAGLFHDIGRSMEIVDQLTLPLSFLRIDDNFENFIKTVRRDAQASLVKYYQNISKTKDVPSTEKINHAVWGSLMVHDMLSALITLRKKTLMLQPAIDAIMNHIEPEQSIQLVTQPISFLLYLCDRLQEWGRPRLMGSQIAADLEVGLRYWLSPVFRWSQSSESISILARVDKHIKGLCLNLDDLHFIIDYLPAERGVLEPAVIWLSYVKDFQDLDLQNSGIKLKITMCHPISKALTNLNWPETEFDLLKNFREENKQEIYATNLVDTIDQKRHIISYKFDNSKRSEMITIDVSSLATTPVLDKLPKNLHSVYHEWKWKFLEHRQSKTKGAGF